MEEIKIIQLPKHEDIRGNLSFIEENNMVPFDIKRTYWIYDVPGGMTRGGHAFKTQMEFIVSLSGSFDVVVDDGKQEKIFSLSRSYYGLFLPCGYWRRIENFSTNSVAMILSSTFFSEEDYIRNYDEFIKYKKL